MRIFYILVVVLILSAGDAIAQQDSTTYFMMNSGQIASNKDSADFKLIVFPPVLTSQKRISAIKAYSMDGKIKLAGSSLTAKFPLNLEGDFTEYYPNGNKKKLRHFDNGRESAGFTTWYENGNLQSEVKPEGNIGVSEKDYFENGRAKLERLPKGGGYFDETEYDADGTLLRKLTTNDLGRGAEIIYYKNGATKKITSFIELGVEQKIVAYYSNGKPYFTKETVPGDDGPVTRYIECNDSTGKPLTQKGKGHWIEYSDDFSYKAFEGNVVKELPDSIWNIAYSATEGDYQTFKGGKLIAHNVYGESDPVPAISYDTPPKFPDGLDAFYRFIAKNLRYPASAREKNIMGRVIIRFVVEKDGSISDVEVVRDIGGGCGAEAARVIKISPKWLPAMQKGIPVRTQFSVPVTFTLTRM